jgi:hypothetical protein
LLDAALTIQKPQLALVGFVAAVYALHELQDIHLLVAMGRNGSTYGNDLTQTVLI